MESEQSRVRRTRADAVTLCPDDLPRVAWLSNNARTLFGAGAQDRTDHDFGPLIPGETPSLHS